MRNTPPEESGYGGAMKRAWIAGLLLALSACGGGDSGDSGGAVTATEVAADIASQIDSVTKAVEITESNDGNDLIGRPNGYETATVIYDSRVECSDLSVECGATVEQWPDADAATERSDYIQGVLKDAPMFGTEYHYLNGAVLLRVWGDLKPSEANEYEEVFAG